MRINKFVANATGLSRRASDRLISEGRISINRQTASLGDAVKDTDIVALDDQPVTLAVKTITIILHKPTGYVSSREGQGSQTIYDLLPRQYHKLKPVGRLDKNSSGLLLLTNDGELANQLTHPRYAKTKIYNIGLDKLLQPLHQQMISDHGVRLEDGLSRLALQNLDDSGLKWQVTMSEGRNRQIRRTFAGLGYEVLSLQRSQFGPYSLQDLAPGQFCPV